MNVSNEEFTSSRYLVAGANYAFRVAAVNNFGVGRFSELLMITTQEKSEFYLEYASQLTCLLATQNFSMNQLR